MTTRPGVAGLLLTGGASTRMGRDKATLEIDGIALASRLGDLLAEVVEVALEVGPGASGLEAVSEDPPGGGPLRALVAGSLALAARGHRGPVLVLACDLPLLTAPVLAALADSPGDASIVPVVGGHPQPLCARLSPGDLALAAQLVAAGESSMRALLRAATPVLVDLDADAAAARALTDVDTPADLAALGLRPAPPVDPGTLR